MNNLVKNLKWNRGSIAATLMIAASLNSVSLRADANPTSVKYFMAGIGDSMTSASLSDLSAMETDRQEKASFFSWGVLKDLVIKEGANQMTFSWSTGQDVASHYKRLEEWLHKNEPGMVLERKNYSIPGGKAETLPGQMDKVVAEFNGGDYKAIKLVTISIGGNDLCTVEGEVETAEAALREQLHHSFDILSAVKQDEPIRIFFTGLPNVPGLGRQEILETKTMQDQNCNQFQTSGHNSCPNLLNYQNEQEYQAAVDKVVAVNGILRSVVEEASAKHPHLEFVFSTKFFETTVLPEWLAVDCFHPNQVGQEELARITWEDQTWFN